MDVRLQAFSPSALGIVLGVPRVTREQAAELSGAVALLPGPMFDSQGPEYLLNTGDAGVQTRHPERGATLSVVGGRAVVLDGGHRAEGASVAVQGYPVLIRSGRVVATGQHDTDTTGRSAVGVLTDGRAFFVTGTGPMLAFAQELQRRGAVEAIYTDGGSSLAAGARLPAWLVALPERGGLGWLVGALAVGAGAAAGVWWARSKGRR